MTNPSPELSPQAGAHAGQAQISVTLRYFAAATEAAGRPEERLDSVSTPADSLTPLTDGDAVDVLPPFAGG